LIICIKAIILKYFVSVIECGTINRKQKKFDEIVALWKKKGQQSLAQFTMDKTESCFTFSALEEYVRGNYDSGQQSHVISCTHCQNMARLFEKYGREPWWGCL